MKVNNADLFDPSNELTVAIKSQEQALFLRNSLLDLHRNTIGAPGI